MNDREQLGTKSPASDQEPANVRASPGMVESLPQVVTGTDRTVLVVDDDAPLRKLLRVVLERDGRLSVIGEAAEGAEALRLIDEHDPDLVLLDLAMPKLDGIGVLNALDGRERPVVVVLSADGYDNAEGTVLGLGAAAYVSKATAFAGLADVLLEAVRQRSR